MRGLLYMICALLLVSCGVSVAERNNTGNKLAQHGDYQPAIQAYQAAQVIEPNNGLLYFNAANAYIHDDRVEEAQAALQQAIQRGDKQLASSAYYNLGNLHFQLGDYETAIEDYREALRQNPDNADARYNLEFALSSRLKPTPTDVEMQTDPEEQQANPSATPTPNPFGEDFPTPTPTPTPPDNLPPPGPTPIHQGEDKKGDEDNTDQSTPIPRIGAEFKMEDAERLLEPVDANQEIISTFRDNYNRQGKPESKKDW